MSNTEIKRPVLSLNVVGPSDDNNEFIVGTMVDGNDQYPAIQFGGTTFEAQNGELHISGDLVVGGDVYTDGSDEPVGPGGGTHVAANSGGVTTDTLQTLQVGDVNYSVPERVIIVPNEDGVVPTETLETLQIGETVYGIPSGGGGSDILSSDNVFTGENTFEQPLNAPGIQMGTETENAGIDVIYDPEGEGQGTSVVLRTAKSDSANGNEENFGAGLKIDLHSLDLRSTYEAESAHGSGFVTVTGPDAVTMGIETSHSDEEEGELITSQIDASVKLYEVHQDADGNRIGEIELSSQFDRDSGFRSGAGMKLYNYYETGDEGPSIKSAIGMVADSISLDGEVLVSSIVSNMNGYQSGIEFTPAGAVMYSGAPDSVSAAIGVSVEPVYDEEEPIITGEKSVINLQADEVLVNGEPIGSGGGSEPYVLDLRGYSWTNNNEGEGFIFSDTPFARPYVLSIYHYHTTINSLIDAINEGSDVYIKVWLPVEADSDYVVNLNYETKVEAILKVNGFWNLLKGDSVTAHATIMVNGPVIWYNEEETAYFSVCGSYILALHSNENL